MPSTPTPRLSLTAPLGSEAVNLYPPLMLADLTTLDNAVTVTRGTISSRPAAAAVPRDSMYYGTDTAQYYVSNGTVWTPFAPALASTVTSANHTAVPFESVLATGGGSTITLPAPSAGSLIAVQAGSIITGANPVTVAYSSPVIFGPGLPSGGASSFLLGSADCTVMLLGTSTTWIMIAGQQDTGWVPLTLAAGWTAYSGGPVPAGRLQGDSVRLKGTITNGTGGTSGNPGSVPAACTPSIQTNLLGLSAPAMTPTVTTPLSLTIAATGAMTCTAIQNGSLLTLNGITYTLA